ncbi:nucleotide pyrophosphatase [Acidianus sulfidivorans JP7]|uniref:Nucleotide pyrophosphatase n=1 Tax=Acidianus sulfidivorans JP7 TaxID=619593 RepID=A0A2U9IKU3_9CREN|nr:alkaline phosphatase family protein [Acidianus sulfidivorans]AWR96626.1 nucleotide pyrophosphatase [Acidianus sulfidivorans JP7]
MSLLLPNYEKNIYSLACGIADFLGVKRNCISKINISGKRLALVLLDGFGWNILSKSTSIVKEAEKIQTVFPSTTSTVITTLFTAQTPGEHGILGYNTFVKKLGGIINALKFTHPAINSRDAIEPSIPFESAFPNVKSYLSEVKDKKTIEIIPKNIDGTEFSKATHAKTSETKNYIDDWDAIYTFSQVLQNNYDFVYLYIPTVDSLAHKFGPYSEPTLTAAKYIFESIYNISKKYPEYTVIITADHGHVEVGNNIDMNSNTELLGMLDVPPYGDSRALFLRSRYDMKTYLYNRYNLRVFTKDEFPSLFGKIDNNVDLPDYIAVPLDNTAYIFDYKENGEYGKLKGHHGGLLSEEFEIPLVTING